MSDKASRGASPEHTTPAKTPTKTPPTRAPQQPAAPSIQRAIADPAAASPQEIVALHKTIGNRAVNRLLASAAVPKDSPPGGKRRLQFKLNVGPAGDEYEQEADRVASQVMRMSAPTAPPLEQDETGQVQRQLLSSTITPLAQRDVEEEADEDTAQGQAAPQRPEDGFEAGSQIESRLEASKGSGQPLSGETRSFMEGRFGADFGNVRVHTGGESAQLNRAMSAQAFTHGSDIYMGAGKYNPGTSAGRQLLAHELTHTIQQGASPSLGVQRFMTSNQLRQGAGREKKDWKIFGKTIKSMSAKYKAVLAALDRYNGILPGIVVYSAYGTVAPFGPGKAATVLERLAAVETACQNYLEGHEEGDDRVRHIQAILDDIPDEREAINTIAANPQKYPNRSLEQAISQYRALEQAAVNVLKNKTEQQLTEAGTPGLSGGALGEAALGSYKSEMEEITSGGQTPTSFSFRGTSTASKQAAAFVTSQGLNYFRTVLLPAMEAAMNTPNDNADVVLHNLPGGDEVPPSPQAQGQLTENIERMRGYYTNLVALFRPNRAADMPMPIAGFCASLYHDAQTKGMAPDHAYLLVSSQIFLRMINPMFVAVISVLPRDRQRATMLLSKLLQDDANKVAHGSKEPALQVFADLDYSEQIAAYVNAVIQRGQG